MMHRRQPPTRAETPHTLLPRYARHILLPRPAEYGFEFPFSGGQPSGPVEDFLSGFVAELSKSMVYGRPCGVTELPDGSILVADDAANTIWRVDYKG